jgi:hypothetical protein
LVAIAASTGAAREEGVRSSRVLVKIRFRISYGVRSQRMWGRQGYVGVRRECPLSVHWRAGVGALRLGSR